MRLTSKGQVTIPEAIRNRLGRLPHTEVEFDIVGDSVRIGKKRGTTSRGERLLALMRAARPRKKGLTTDQIMAMTRGDD